MSSTVCMDLCERWEEDYIANKNPFACIEDEDDFDNEFDFDDFADLIKESYLFLKEINEKYKSSVTDLYKENPDFLFDYTELVSLIRSYGTTEDLLASTNKYFASMLVAKLFAEECSLPFSAFDGIIHIGKITENVEEIIYDIEKGDFTEIIENCRWFSEILTYCG